jgi:hypothetical protein
MIFFPIEMLHFANETGMEDKMSDAKAKEQGWRDYFAGLIGEDEVCVGVLFSNQAQITVTKVLSIDQNGMILAWAMMRDLENPRDRKLTQYEVQFHVSDVFLPFCKPKTDDK